MKKKLTFIIFLFYIKNFLFSGGIEIINIPFGKSLSLANEKAIVNNYGLSSFTNPAILVGIPSNYTVEYNRLFYYNNTSYDIVSLTSKSFDRLCAGLSFGGFTSGEIQAKNIDGLLTGETFEYALNLASLGIGAKLLEDDYNLLNFGFASIVILEKIDTDNIFFGFSSGLFQNFKVKTKFLKSIILGVSVNTVTNEKIFNYNASLGVQTGYTLIFFGYEGYSLTKNEKLKVGTSFNLYTSNDFKKYVYLNIGYQTNTSFISSGIDFRIYNFGICYSFGNHKNLGMLHSLSIILFI